MAKLIHVNDKTKSYLFGTDVSYRKMHVTDVGRYSITRPGEREQICRIIQEKMKDTSKLTITDATAGNGGDVLGLSKIFKHVNAVELDPVNCEAVKHNLIVAHVTNTSVVCGDFNKVFPSLQQDALVMDPPWGGPDYKTRKNVRMTLGPIETGAFLRSLQRQADSGVLWAFVKVPTNADLSTFPKNKEVHNILNHRRVIGFLLISVKIS